MRIIEFILQWLFGKKQAVREVACLFATKPGEVLLATKDGRHWHFPQEVIRVGPDGKPTETPLDAIHRIVGNLDNIEEIDVVSEKSKRSLSHRGEETEYHLFMTDSKPVAGNLPNGLRCEWTNEPNKKTLNAFTRAKLRDYCFEVE